MNKKYYPSIKNSVVICLLYTALSIILGGLLGFVIGFMPSPTDTGLVMSLGLILIIIIIYLILFKMILTRMEVTKSEFFNMNYLTPKIIISFIIMMIGLYILNLQVAVFINKLLPVPQYFTDLFDTITNDDDIILSFISILIIPVIFEEILFRGFILKGLIRNYSAKTAIIISALLFGVIHLNPWQFVSAFLLGLIVAWITLKTKSIIYAMIGHFTNNLISMYYKKLSELPFIKLFEGKNGMISPVLLFIAVVFFLTGLYTIKTQLKNEPLKPVEEPQIEDITA